MKDRVFRLDEAVPVFDDRLLPAIRPVAIAADVLVEEMSIRDYILLVTGLPLARRG
jgi:hypothetical protein